MNLNSSVNDLPEEETSSTSWELPTEETTTNVEEGAEEASNIPVCGTHYEDDNHGLTPAVIIPLPATAEERDQVLQDLERLQRERVRVNGHRNGTWSEVDRIY